ncbi:putative late blight resistance protein homolog R1B-16 [Rhododendron vialii]|uniref:putative late blight resistance protein homolog R1B-16 n=1 Tax=Rhododendron vialii TaxID=182163 RepID=UPI00265D82BB|nr:putative late blight resistance protein homolog R1B-16 [Rhododendron vialii]
MILVQVRLISHCSFALRLNPDDEKHQLQSLAEEIKYLRGFLKITEKKRNEHSEVMNLAMRIRDVISVAENEVEQWVVIGFKANHASDSLRELGGLIITGQYAILHRFSPFIVQYFCLLGVEEPQYHPQNFLPCKHHRSLHLGCVKKKIKTLTVEVKHILDENLYDINEVAVKKLKQSSTGSGGGSNPSKVVEEKVVVGFKEDVKTLMGKLHDNGQGGQLEIISITGAAGGGKTTLAKEVYDQRLTLESFEIHAWVVVSQDYDKIMKKHLLICILKSAFPENQEDYEKGNEDTLGEKLHKYLRGKKYLIVMDDIWGIEAWNDIQRSFPRERKGSKVVFTSRLPIQSDSIYCIPHRLAPLPKCCSWELLEKKVFGKKQCPPELMDIGKQIAEKCKGLPLTIVTIAGILATEDKTPDVWEDIAKHLSSTIAKNQEGCMKILELSYNHLPFHLKACFLYIGAHPEDYEIPVRELIWLWIAEGFIPQSAGRESLEAIAEDYLNCLVDRSLVMVAWKSRSHGGIKACRIHDLLRELCLKKAKEDNFFAKIYEGDFSLCTPNKHRRLFIGSPQLIHKFPPISPPRNLRSFLCFYLANNINHPSTARINLSYFVENFELLRVLHLSPVGCLQEVGIGNLVHLRYLGLSLPHEPPKCAPYVFYYLSNLETFNLHESPSIIPLPCDIVKMVKLRHLYTKRGRFKYHHVSNDEEEGNILDSLQTLHRMCMCGRCLRFLERTPNLRKLGLIIDGDEDDVLMLPDLEFLKCLEILHVTGYHDREHVVRTGLKLPRTLKRLTLARTYLKWEELSIILQTQPSLEVLKLLEDACSGRVWNTSELEEGFSQLKYLRLDNLNIEEWIATEDQFPRLEVLVVRHCRKLKGIPIDFANLYNLREINVMWSSRSAEESAREIQEKQRNTKGDDNCLNLLTRRNVW